MKNKLSYTARAITHLDTFRLDRGEFEAVMRNHPAGALQVCDALPRVLPPHICSKVVNEIYHYAGLRDLLGALRRRWKPTKGATLPLKPKALASAAAYLLLLLLICCCWYSDDELLLLLLPVLRGCYCCRSTAASATAGVLLLLLLLTCCCCSC